MTPLVIVNRQGGPAPALVALLTALAGLGQFASNIYIPSMPAMAAALGVTMSAVQATLAVFLAVFAVFQLVCGPLSDRFGRRPVLLVAMSTFIAGTVTCAVAPDLATLIGGRILQGAGASAAFVVSRAITRDLFTGADLARVTALILIAFSLVPGLTPLIGDQWGDGAAPRRTRHPRGLRRSAPLTILPTVRLVLVARLRLPVGLLRRISGHVHQPTGRKPDRVRPLSAAHSDGLRGGRHVDPPPRG